MNDAPNEPLHCCLMQCLMHPAILAGNAVNSWQCRQQQLLGCTAVQVAFSLHRVLQLVALEGQAAHSPRHLRTHTGCCLLQGVNEVASLLMRRDYIHVNTVTEDERPSHEAITQVSANDAGTNKDIRGRPLEAH
jgi:hypothetical protein